MIEKINIPNIKEKYELSEIKTKMIDNYPIWYKETHEKMFSQRKILSREQFIEMNEREIHSLIDVRINEFKKIWGKQDFIYKGEYNMYAWVVESEGCQAIIFSGKGKGTIVEIILNEKGRPKGSIENFFYQYKDLMQFLKYGDINDYELFKKNSELYNSARKYNL